LATVLGADVAIGGLTIADNANNFALNADGYALTIGSGGITKSNTTSRSAALAANLVLGAAQTWSNSDTGSPLVISGQVTGANDLTVGGAGNTSLLGRVLTGTGTLTKTGTGTLELSGFNGYSGATAINAGTLEVDARGSINASAAVTVAAGAKFAYNSSLPLTALTSLDGTGTGPTQRAVLGGTGTISLALSLDNTGDVLSPGNSPGIMSFTTGQTWSSFGYDWELNDWAASVAGTNIDQIQITGGLSLTGATAGSYVVDVLSLTADNVAGNVTNFADATNSWTILTTTAGITGFDPARWTVDSSGFTSTPTATGTWNVGLSNDSQNLVLNYVAVPEPSTLVLAAAGLVALGWRLRRRA
jgi:autotransporter-associated beta strand protein